jgi:hypothetical protein
VLASDMPVNVTRRRADSALVAQYSRYRVKGVKQSLIPEVPRSNFVLIQVLRFFEYF